ncbi:hypothetical protein L218DRAFT_890746 [Marasmius fiardii PR-910]|nr:hypothetical protein L218DRAFT_890746 [Marasmius fiardii PR-910]
MTSTTTTLPIELVREIISQVFYQTPPDKDEVGITSKPSWSLASSLFVASKTFRVLALEFWFSTLFIKRPSDLLDSGLMFDEIKSHWTRELHCVQCLPFDSTSTLPIWKIQGFQRLKSFRFDWVMPIPDDQSLLAHGFREQPMITKLDVRGMEWPSPKVMKSIASLFPALEFLHLEQDSVWCGLCHTCSVPSFKNTFLATLTYKGGMGLPSHYATMLAPLKHLKEVCISVGCDDSGNTSLGTGPHENEKLWSGECDKCIITLLHSDEQFERDWIARKKNDHQRPPLLEKVNWRFRSNPK